MAPFKFSQDYMDIIGGSKSDTWERQVVASRADCSTMDQGMRKTVGVMVTTRVLPVPDALDSCSGLRLGRTFKRVHHLKYCVLLDELPGLDS